LVYILGVIFENTDHTVENLDPSSIHSRETTMSTRTIGSRLEQLLKVRGVSKLEFSRELQARRRARLAAGRPPLRKVDRPAIYAVLAGEDVPPVDTLEEMARILQVRFSWLATGEEPMERDLEGSPAPLWLVDGHRGAWRRPRVRRRLEARQAFVETFFSRCPGFAESEPIVQRMFSHLLDLRLRRRRSRGDRGPALPEYRAETARGLYLKCFLDLAAETPEGTTFGSPAFTQAFLARMDRWLKDEEG
jgi:transcriptional regulator with XRE-family HTH domain